MNVYMQKDLLNTSQQGKSTLQLNLNDTKYFRNIKNSIIYAATFCMYI